MVRRCLSPVPVHQCPTPSTIRLLSRLGHPVRSPKYHSPVVINLIVLVSLFHDPSVGHPAGGPHGPLTSHYSGHQPTVHYLGPYTSATAMDHSSSSMDLTPSTNTNPPQLPAPRIPHPGGLGAPSTSSMDAQGHTGPTFLQPPLPTTSSEVSFFPQPPSR